MSAKCFCPVNLKHSLVKALSLSYNCYFFLQRVQADRGQWEKCVKRKYTHFLKFCLLVLHVFPLEHSIKIWLPHVDLLLNSIMVLGSSEM